MERRVAVVALAVGEGAFQRLGHEVHELRPDRVHRAQVVVRQHLEDLQQHRALRPGPAFPDGPARRDRRQAAPPTSPATRHVLTGEHAFAPLAGGVEHAGLAQVGVDGLGHEAAGMGAARGLDLRLPAGPGGLALGHEAPPHRAQSGLRKSAPASGARPPGSQTGAEVGHSFRNTSCSPAMAEATPASIGCPCSA
jgi:hypothetical protein